MKWRIKFELKKRNQQLRVRWLYIIYQRAINEAGEVLLEASYNKERRKLLNHILNYELDASFAATESINIEKYRRKITKKYEKNEKFNQRNRGRNRSDR
jgi:hypothetical protein